ncbi:MULTISPECIES: hypothetical protein [unclassified Lysobacter]|uniref:hypothetical protein n=1 Tax=unclassified Lysobacter TaxID=2635362 RepID=UPI0006F6F48A|nr:MULTISPECIES: hypothetical protein [unclassified Lysobacter]
MIPTSPATPQPAPDPTVAATAPRRRRAGVAPERRACRWFATAALSQLLCVAYAIGHDNVALQGVWQASPIALPLPPPRHDRESGRPPVAAVDVLAHSASELPR